MAAALGKIDEFNLKDDDIDEYYERVEQYLYANDVDDEKKQTAIFLTVMGSETYSLLRNLLTPEVPSKKTIKVLYEKLKEHLKPKPIVIARRYVFHSRDQHEGESLNEFYAALRKLSLDCEFKTFLDESLRDRFICGMRSDRIRQRLFTEKTLELKVAVQTAINMEQASLETQAMKNDHLSEKSSGNDVENLYAIQTKRNPGGKKCYRCESEFHLADKCKHISTVCSFCKKPGHVIRACRKKKEQEAESTNSGGIKKDNKCNKTVHDVDKDSDDENFTYVVKSFNHKEPLQVEMGIGGQKILFEVDTGSGVTLISERTYQRCLPNHELIKTNTVIKTYSNEELKVIGRLKVNATYDGVAYRDLKPMYVISGDGVNLIGRSWLAKIKLDWKQLFSDSSYHANKVCSKIDVKDELKKTLNKHSKIFSEKLGKIRGLTAKLNVESGATPKFTKARPVPFALQEAVENEIMNMQDDGILVPITHSDWASPIVIVPKSDGRVRICGDYKRTVNPVISNEIYPQPTPDELFAKMQGGKKFTKIDLTKAYLQVELDEDAKKYLVINTMKGLMQFQRMPNGVKPASGIFQRYIENELKDIPYTVVKIDDILISGRNDEEHLKNVDAVLEVLEKIGATVNKGKCAFFANEIEYVGFIIDKEGVRTNPKKIKAIVELPEPTDLKQLQSFLGGINYYSKFIPNMADITKPLYSLLEKKTEWRWSQNEQDAFEELKSLLMKSPVLALYDPKLPIKVACDASKYGLGAVISNIFPNGEEKAIAYASRTLNKHEINYSQIDKEGAAVIFALKKFNQYLLGNKFKLSVDNKTIRKVFDPSSDISPIAVSRLVRWALILSQYDYEIEFKPTKDHGNADMLSRLPRSIESELPADNLIYSIQISSLPVLTEDIRTETSKDETLSRVIEYMQNDSWPNIIDDSLRPYHLKRTELLLEDGIILWGLRVVIPESLRQIVLHELHHECPGMVRMKSLSRIHAWYPNIDRDIELMVRECKNCEKESNVPPKSDPHPWSWPTKPMDRVHVDYFEYNDVDFLIMVDSYSKWVDVEIITKCNSTNTINCLRKWFSHYGLPNQLISDNGSQFTSEEFKNYVNVNGIKHIRTAAYHQSSNGQAERYVQTVKHGLHSIKSKSHRDLNEKLESFLMTYRSTPHTITEETPSKRFLGRNISTRLDLMRPRITVERTNVIKDKKVRELKPGEKVVSRRFNSKDKWISGVIVEKTGSKLYKIRINGIIVIRHIDQIKRSYTSDEIEADAWDFTVPLHSSVGEKRYPTRRIIYAHV